MLLAFIINSLIVAVAVFIHYEFLYKLSLIIPKMSIKKHLRLIVGVLGALIAHTIEIWLFAFSYYLLNTPWFGTMKGTFDGSFLDCIYFSFTTYTTLGIGDISPLGNMRFLVGLEALTGLVLITWSASFLFTQMQKFWNK